MFRFLRTLYMIIIVLFATTSIVHAVNVEEFDDELEWQNAVGGFSTIDFTGFNNFQVLQGDEFSDLGVTLDADIMWAWHTPLFENDGEGLEAPGGLWLHFDEPQSWIAADHPGRIWFDLYNGETQIYESPFLGMGGGGTGFFSGLVSSHTFDRVYVYKPEPLFDNVVFIDDLHFGPPIPAPGALGVIVLGSLWLPRSRRH